MAKESLASDPPILELRGGTLEANSNITVNANGTDGILIGGGQLVIFGSPGGGLNLESNTTGLLADGAGSLLLVPNPANPSVIRGNIAFDVDLRFGTRMNVISTSLGNLKCDGTVLIKGARCP